MSDSKGKGDPHHEHPEVPQTPEEVNMSNENAHEHVDRLHEREFETGMSEAFTQSSIEKDRISFLNQKRTYDLHQDYADERARSNNRNSDVLNQLAQQALQNAVETANMVAKQAVRHGDVAIDRQWNINETDNLATIVAKAMDTATPLRSVDAAVAKSVDTSAAIQGIAAALAAAIADALKDYSPNN